MKSKYQNQNKTLHQQIEQISRHRVSVFLVSSLMVLGFASLDARLARVVHEAYLHGFGLVGAYMREETVRSPANFGATPKIVTSSGR